MATTASVAKPGPKTTEFWATLLTHAFTIGASAFVLIDQPFPDRLAALQVLVPTVAFIASSIVQAGYNISRGKVKEAMIQVVGRWDDAEAVYDALFPTSPTPASVKAAADVQRAARADRNGG